MVLPQAVLKAATRGPVLVELKNGDSYSGALAAVDNLMNIRLEDAIHTPRLEYRFERLKECTIRGQFVKFIRFPDDLLETVAAREAAIAAAKGSGKGRGRGKGRGKSDFNIATARVSVPASLVGAIIGRGGDTIRQLSTDSGARIEVSKEATPGAGSPSERWISLSGSAESVEKAKEMIEALVKERTGNRGNRDRGDRHGGAGDGHHGHGQGGHGGHGGHGGGSDRRGSQGGYRDRDVRSHGGHGDSHGYGGCGGGCGEKGGGKGHPGHVHGGDGRRRR